ncbi:tetratricopeptide (TPR) repeat protein [Pedobacter sp. AK017]|uniref:RagB/SusD family nutrient uptake outer membrane protein n=1 Tax=Pedobacter sp. AK017 TaxID=2723073 RepID=UPI00160E7396|nr:RagB/SusD family nutrient uptake outer membrane protein [Pedobacter sp. AK017]MBB5436353.1 tetratricopeptide (TPR) repeat protein [Pedobacter sp. AK017]
MMMNTRHYILTIIVLILVLFTNACKKSSFLDANPNDSLIIPKTVGQYQSLLDDYSRMNYGTPYNINSGSDDYYLLPGFFDAFYDETAKNAYIWNDNIWFQGSGALLNWNIPYSVIFNANLVLHGLKDIQAISGEQTAWNNLKGHALFLRAFHFYQLSQLFLPVYSVSSANSQLGLPLRLGIDIDESIKRSTVQETYNQIIKDLNEAKELLHEQSGVKTRPSKHAVYALLSRIYLSIGDYESALQNANASLAINNTLLDYNVPDVLSKGNVEIIWPAKIAYDGLQPAFDFASSAVDEDLLGSYSAKDKRIAVFFDINQLGGKYFKGTYNFSQNEEPTSLFTGLATDEIYLIRAECYARLGNKDLALADLNTLMVKRWVDDGSWVPFTATTAAEALDKILVERRKELVFRGLRWSDLRRLNSEGRNITLTRKLDDGTIVSLAPNSLKYTYLIPPSVIGFHPEMPQNPR